MHKWPLQLRLIDKPRFIPLRYRVVLANSGMLILLLGVLILTLVWFQSRTIRQQLEQRGKAIGQSIVATSTNALLNYDYITLEQFANRAAQDPNILYVVVHDKEHRVAGYSNRPDLQGQSLTDETSQRALAATDPLVQQIEMGPEAPPGLDVESGGIVVHARSTGDTTLGEFRLAQPWSAVAPISGRDASCCIRPLRGGMTAESRPTLR